MSSMKSIYLPPAQHSSGFPTIDQAKAIQVPKDRRWTRAESYALTQLLRPFNWEIYASGMLEVLGTRMDRLASVYPGNWLVISTNADRTPAARGMDLLAFVEYVNRQRHNRPFIFSEPDDPDRQVRAYTTSHNEVVEAFRLYASDFDVTQSAINTSLHYLLRGSKWHFNKPVGNAMSVVASGTKYGLNHKDWLVRTANGSLQVYPNSAFRFLFTLSLTDTSDWPKEG